MSNPERFEIERNTRRWLLAAPWIFVVLAVLSASSPFLFPADGNAPNSERGAQVLAALGLLLFGSCAWYSVTLVRRLPTFAIAADHDGLWPAEHPRDTTLVRWNQVHLIRERPRFQRLELADASGITLIRIEYQLRDFERLRAIVIERAQLASTSPWLGRTFSRRPTHHLENISGMLGVSAMGLYLGPDRPALGYGTVFLVVAIGWDYLTTVYRLTIAGDSLELAWPLRRRKLNRSDVTSASLSDDIDEHENRTSRVTLKLTHPDRVIQLRALGTPAMDLERAIVAWMKNVA